MADRLFPVRSVTTTLTLTREEFKVIGSSVSEWSRDSLSEDASSGASFSVAPPGVPVDDNLPYGSRLRIGGLVLRPGPDSASIDAPELESLVVTSSPAVPPA